MKRKFVRLLIVLSALFAPAAPAVAAPAPAWQIVGVPFPSNFTPGGTSINTSGPAYLFQATNVGGGATSGVITVTATLPGPLQPSSLMVPFGFYGHKLRAGTDSSKLSCAIAGRTITCTTDAKIAVAPGESVTLKVPVDVAAGAPPLVTSKAGIEGGGAAKAATSVPTTVSPEPADFGLLQGPASLYGSLTDADGSTSTQAGSHPYQATIGGMSFTLAPADAGQAALVGTGGGVRDVVAELPPGLIVNPGATPVRCTESELESGACPDGSQVGTIGLALSVGGLSNASVPLYNMVPVPGSPAEFGFEIIEGTYAHLFGSVRSDGSFVLSAFSNEILARVAVGGVSPQLWGVPSDPSHDTQRGACITSFPPPSGCAVERTGTPFISLPSSCGGPLTTTVHLDSWKEPGVFVDGSYESADLEGNPVGIDGCDLLEFNPTISAQPTTRLADSPSGLDFDLHLPQAPPAEAGPGASHQVCSDGWWSGQLGSYPHQWLRNGVPIPGATSREYQIGPDDFGTSLQCEVVAVNEAAGPGHAVSAPVSVAPVPSTLPPTPAKPTISAEAGENPLLLCNPGSWGGEPSFEYQWFKNGSPAPGQTASTYQVQPDEAPLTLQCEVSGSNAGGTVVAFSANWTSSPPLVPPLPDVVTAPAVGLAEGAIPLATANLKDTRVTLPAGMSLNPSAAGGLQACSSAQIGLKTAAGETPIRYLEVPQACPSAAKVGTVEVTTPLLDHALPGSVYLAEPFDNPFGSLLAIYLAIEDPRSGTIAKLAGKVEADPSNGRLSATFSESPQLPLEDIRVHFFNGPRATLTTPLACGSHSTTSVLTPWSTPEGADATPSDSFQTSEAPGGGVCPSSESTAPNSPAFTAGTLSPQAGAYSPFVLRLSREDGTQRLTAIEATLPEGLVGRLVGIPYCSEAQIAAAQSRSKPEQGALEQASPSCPLASEVGTVNVGAGSGTPLYVQGHAYLAGSYKGAPLSLVIITPAVAGPFDLGTVVVRTALRVNPETAQIHAVSDPLPTILHGIPLDVRSIALTMDRPSFTLNPTSCDPMAIAGTAVAASGQAAALSSRFQVGGCSALKFKPKLTLRLKGGTKRNSHPALTAVATAKPGEANIAKVSVALPRSAFLDQAHIKTVCTRVQFWSGAIPGEGCPKRSIYGRATATTPLLAEPVSGPVFLRSSNNELPDLVAALHGQVDVVVAGRVDSLNGGLRNSFEAVPDAPVTKFVLRMQGGNKGLIVNSRDLCKSAQRATVRMDGQNGKTFDSKPLIKNSCKKTAKKQKRQRR